MTKVAFAGLALAAAVSARAGVVLEYQGSDKKMTTVELEGKKLRAIPESDGQGGHWTIFDGDKHVIYLLDGRDKTYRRVDEASVGEMAKGLQEAMEKAKAKMTPEQRAQMEAYLAKQEGQTGKVQPKPHSWSFERSGGGQTVAGCACDNYRVLRDGTLESEGCFVRWNSGGFKKDDFQAFQEMGRFAEKMAATMMESTGRGSQQGLSQNLATRFVDTAPGFPAEMASIDKDGKRTHEFHLVKAERKSVAADRFVPPTDYREKPMSMRGD